MQGLRTVDGPEALIRLGLHSKTELRFYVPDYYYNQSIGLNTGAPPGSGFGDLAIGVKQQLCPTLGGFDVSVVAFVSLPTGANIISSHGYDPGLQVPWSHALSPKWTLGGMLSLYGPTQGGRRNLTGEPTIVLSRKTSLLPFLEPGEESTDKSDYIVCSPRCHSRDFVFQGLGAEPKKDCASDAGYNWTCDSCGHHWKDDGVEEKL